MIDSIEEWRKANVNAGELMYSCENFGEEGNHLNKSNVRDVGEECHTRSIGGRVTGLVSS